jgi:hypothetical protein
MDLIVARTGDGGEWTLTDLLGRTMGLITQSEARTFTIEPAGPAVEPMTGLRPGPYPSLDEALAAIERHTRGVCRRKTGITNEWGL